MNYVKPQYDPEPAAMVTPPVFNGVSPTGDETFLAFNYEKEVEKQRTARRAERVLNPISIPYKPPPPPPPPIEPALFLDKPALKNEPDMPILPLIPKLAPLVGNIASKIFPKKPAAAAVISAVPDIATRVIEAQGNRPFLGASNTAIVTPTGPQMPVAQQSRQDWYKSPVVIVGGVLALLSLAVLIFRPKRRSR